MSNTHTHIIGDPCYSLHTTNPEGVSHMDGLWVKSFCEALEQARNDESFSGLIKYMGHTIFVHDTSLGDGQYPGSDGILYSVDAGIIGAIPLALIEPEVIEEIKDLPYIKFVTMTDDQLSNAEYEDGTFTFYTSEGKLQIKTSAEEDYECDRCGASICEDEHHEYGLCYSCIEDDEEEW